MVLETHSTFSMFSSTQIEGLNKLRMNDDLYWKSVRRQLKKNDIRYEVHVTHRLL